ncbi:MAG: hypothetical protein CO090_08965 [Acidobacteria bacterium CG_4_9_14_3_um_filter_49_7]|nr:MAG: hypothetical protein CO090_08965 [Acidobacteria bacterium CG_4_9_14_3_um_filter_49_7]
MHPGVPHRIVKRGNCRQDVSLKEGDQRAYLNILKEQAEKNQPSIWELFNRILKPQKRSPKGPWKHKKQKGDKISNVIIIPKA